MSRYKCKCGYISRKAEERNPHSKICGQGELAPARGSAIPPMPPNKVIPRRPYDDRRPDGYLESIRDWAMNNSEAVEWFLENAEAIRTVLPNS